MIGGGTGKETAARSRSRFLRTRNMPNVIAITSLTQCHKAGRLCGVETETISFFFFCYSFEIFFLYS